MKKIFIVFLLLGLYSISFAGFGGDSLGNHKATKDLNMQEHDIINAGTVRANEFDGNFSTGVPHIIECKAGENLTKGDVVYKSGSVATKMQVMKADFDDNAKDDAIGFAFETANNGQDILVIMNGMLNDIDTSGRVTGNIYLWETGDYTSSKPSSGVVQNLGDLVFVNAVLGTIYVHVHPPITYVAGGIGENVDVRMGDGGIIAWEDGQDNHLAEMSSSSQTIMPETFYHGTGLKSVRSFTVTVGSSNHIADFDINDYANDSACFQAALTYLNDNTLSGGTIKFLDGDYIFSADNRIETRCENVRLTGNGKGTRFFWGDNIGEDTPFYVRHSGFSMSNIYHKTIADEASINAIEFSSANVILRNLNVNNCWFETDSNGAARFLAFDDCKTVNVTDNQFKVQGSNSVCIGVTKSSDVVISNNISECPAVDPAWIFANVSGELITISNNTLQRLEIKLSGGEGIDICNIEDNIIDFRGLDLEDVSRGVHIALNKASNDIKIQGNTIMNGVFGVDENPSSANIDNVTVIGNRIDCSTGVAIAADGRYWQIQGNDFKDCNVDIQDAGTGTRIRNNIDETGDWHAMEGSLNMDGHDITGADDISAVSFTGDGSGLTGITSTVYKDVPFFVPGDAYVTTGIDYRAPLGFDMIISTIVVCVSADGTMPSGTADLNFDIQISTGGSEQNDFFTIFNTTYSLQIASGTCWGQATTSDLAVTELKQNYILRLDITQIGNTAPGGDPSLISIWGEQN